MQPTNIIYEIASKPIGGLAELPAAELAEMQTEVETLIALADNIRKWLNGVLMLKYRDKLDARRRELGRTFGEICLLEDGLTITEAAVRTGLSVKDIDELETQKVTKYPYMPFWQGLFDDNEWKTIF